MWKNRPHKLTFASVIFSIFFIHLFLCPSIGRAKDSTESTLDNSKTLTKIQKLSVPFILNQGQVDKRVKFYANTFGGTVFVTEGGEIVYSLPKVDQERKAIRKTPKTHKELVLKEELVGGRAKEVKAGEEAITKVSHFIGDDSSKWKANIPTYGLVNLGEVYQGIEVKLKAYGRSIEKLFYVKAGADPGSIRLKLIGGESLKVNEEGALEIKTALGDVKFSKPVAYQEINGKRVNVAVNYHLLSSELRTQNSELIYGFKVGDYDRTRELVIDPILQSTYLGGNNWDTGYPIAMDSSGNIFVAGETGSTNFPGTTGGAQPSWCGGDDVFVAKLNSTLTSILQSTYLGGSNGDYGPSLAIDSYGNVYVMGMTESTNFPGTSGGAQPSFGGDYDTFVTKFNSSLTSILQSTYLGGSALDCGLSIAIDSSGNVYVAGETSSNDFPGTTGGAQPSYGGGDRDAFVAKLDSRLASILFSDVASGYWAEGYITAIYNAGITTGCAQDDPNTPENERKYCPENSVTRDQMAAFIVRAKEGEPATDYCSTGSPFSDVDANHWACKYIKRLYELGITTGCGQNPLRYCPNDIVTRAQMAAFLARAFLGMQ
jgi:hypothetical protein